MSVIPTKPRVAIIIHGVQTGADKDQNQHLVIKKLIKNRLGNIPLNYKTDIYRYEDVNDKTISLAKKLVKLIAKTPISGMIAGKTMDLVGDVVLNLADNSTAAKVRAGLKKKILDYYKSGNPCYLVAHSLGSIYALDVVNELIQEEGLFDRKHRTTWPIQGLLTIGSPIGLAMFRKDRSKLQKMGPGTSLLRWKNCWDRNDPIISGAIFGKSITGFEIAEKFQSKDKEFGWFIKDVPVNTGKVWIPAHVAYWELPEVGDILVEMMAN